jgi:2-oxoglutarate dehydrogenase E1 component
MMPKSLLRHPLAAARLQDLEHDTFRPVLDDPSAQNHARAIQRVVLCTGKLAIEMLAHKLRNDAQDVAIVRVEMLYPFPLTSLKKILTNYPGIHEVVWVQEEPLNMGAWSYMSSRLPTLLEPNVELNVISRPPRPSPATGFSDLFQFEQERIIEGALRTTVKQYGGENGG